MRPMKTNLKTFPSCVSCKFIFVSEEEPNGCCPLRFPLSDLVRDESMECLAIKWKDDFEASLRSLIETYPNPKLVDTSVYHFIKEILGDEDR